MIVLHCGTLDVEYGGPALSTYLSVIGLRNHNINVKVLMPELPPHKALVHEYDDIVYSNRMLEPRLGFIPGLDKTLSAIGQVNLIHIQGLWQYLAYASAKFARKHNIPYIITLRGMLYPQALAHSSLIKKISLRLYQKNDLQSAACIQATCMEELKYYRDLGFTNPVAVIPNPIEIPNDIVDDVKKDSVFRIGYLGRVHPRKRIERLIYAVAHLQTKSNNNCELVIIGSGDAAYEDFLRAEVKRLGLTNVKFAGFLTGNEKRLAIKNLSVLAVPSDFENFGNIVTEALSNAIPVIASTGTPWQQLVEKKCGWWIPNDQKSIDQILSDVALLDDTELSRMGRKGKEWMSEDFSVNALGLKMKRVYDWIFGAGDKPEYVY